jgi:predicted lipoprotein with Yx(FWY)xxD motif
MEVHMSRTPALAALAAIAAIVLSACSGGTEAPAASSRAQAAPATVLEQPPGTIVSANSTARLGTVVVDGLGFTLYRFDGDRARPPAATCDGECAETWQPVLATDPMRIDGIDKKAVGTVERPGGEVQLTIGGWPVYRHSGEAPGATDGHGADGTWFAVTPKGGKAEAS